MTADARPTDDRPLGVGFIGAGAVVRAIHLPTLARLRDELRVRRIVDVDAAAAHETARTIGPEALGGDDLDEFLADPEVEVVAICSPHALHAEHVIAACRAGKRFILCEKPMATTRAQAEEMARVAAAHGATIVVGAMHAFDPAWIFAGRYGDRLRDGIRLIRSHIVLPGNDRFEAWATEGTPRRGIPTADVATREARADQIRARLLGLGIHDLPLVRRLLPGWRGLEVVAADVLSPFGYAVSLHAEGRIVELVGSFRDHWQPEWRFEAAGVDDELRIDFSPSYVHAGSGTARVSVAGEPERCFGPAPTNGYVAEWQHIVDLVRGRAEAIPVGELVDDLDFALRVADAARDHVLRGSGGAA